MYNPHQYYLAKKEMEHRIKTIPKKNKDKFGVDLVTLIELAHQEGYNDEDVFRR